MHIYWWFLVVCRSTIHSKKSFQIMSLGTPFLDLLWTQLCAKLKLHFSAFECDTGPNNRILRCGTSTLSGVNIKFLSLTVCQKNPIFAICEGFQKFNLFNKLAFWMGTCKVSGNLYIFLLFNYLSKAFSGENMVEFLESS